MTIEYNKILQLYTATLYGCKFYSESVSGCVSQGVQFINTIRAQAGLSKIFIS